MKVEVKMKKNINCELSHMVTPAGSLEVYNQKQNILFISESVEHRMFKVTWARLWVCTAECAHDRVHGRVLGRMHGRVRVSSVCMAECTCQAYARPDGLDGRAARLVVVHGLVGTCPRFGVATHGMVAHGLNFVGMTEPCG